MRDKRVTEADRVRHAIEAIRKVTGFCEGIGRDEFERNMVVHSACLYQYTIIAEALSHVDSDRLSKYEYPWYKVKSFRNFILHDYHSIALTTVYDTTVNELPMLEKLLIEILQKEFSEKP
ncbi:MAG: DUF86 domain-containing protein [Flavobacteriales bacterium]|nr:DUF86 domain-containing protein [Flavobacteriales bacterium]